MFFFFFFYTHTHTIHTVHTLHTHRVLAKLGASDVDQRLEELLIDGILFAFQEQAVDDTGM